LRGQKDSAACGTDKSIVSDTSFRVLILPFFVSSDLPSAAGKTPFSSDFSAALHKRPTLSGISKVQVAWNLQYIYAARADDRSRRPPKK